MPAGQLKLEGHFQSEITSLKLQLLISCFPTAWCRPPRSVCQPTSSLGSHNSTPGTTAFSQFPFATTFKAQRLEVWNRTCFPQSMRVLYMLNKPCFVFKLLCQPTPWNSALCCIAWSWQAPGSARPKAGQDCGGAGPCLLVQSLLCQPQGWCGALGWWGKSGRACNHGLQSLTQFYRQDMAHHHFICSTNCTFSTYQTH